MKRILISLLGGILFLTACAQTSPSTQTVPTPVSEQATVTPSPIATATQTSLPPATPTVSITPLPTIPTFTPTFDARTIVTATPAPKAKCPKENRSVKLDFRFDDQSIDVTQEILKYLNRGDSIQTVINELSTFYYPSNTAYAFTDVTNDGVPDLIFNGFYKLDASGFLVPFNTFYILSCQDGQYSLFSVKMI